MSSQTKKKLGETEELQDQEIGESRGRQRPEMTRHIDENKGFVKY